MLKSILIANELFYNNIRGHSRIVLHFVEMRLRLIRRKRNFQGFFVQCFYTAFFLLLAFFLEGLMLIREPQRHISAAC